MKHDGIRVAVVEQYQLVDAAIGMEAIKKFEGPTDGETGMDFSANAFPNPFNPSTTIAFMLPRDGRVSLKVYDVLGRVVAEMPETMMTAGEHSYLFDASTLPSGVYFYKLEFYGETIVKKLALTK